MYVASDKIKCMFIMNTITDHHCLSPAAVCLLHKQYSLYHLYDACEVAIVGICIIILTY